MARGSTGKAISRHRNRRDPAHWHSRAWARLKRLGLFVGTVERVSGVPVTRHAHSGGVEIAFQCIGAGDVSVVNFPAARFPIDLVWDQPEARRFLERLASFSRMVLFDPRGWAASARTAVAAVPTAEDWADDIALVMDATDMERAAVIGQGEGAMGSLYFAAAHPERVSALVLFGGFARYRRADDYPVGIPDHVYETYSDGIEAQYGTGELARLLVPSRADDAEFRSWWGRCERLSTTPSLVRQYWRDLVSRDVRSLLPIVRVPTLVIHRSGDRYVRAGHGRYLAEHIANAAYVELSGDDHIPWVGDAGLVLDRIEEFLTGTVAARRIDRVLATVLFTDIVDSTRTAVRMGDRAWRGVLDRHDDTVRRLVDRHRGRLIKSTGDGVLVTFDGPSRAIDCAAALRAEMAAAGVVLRAGLHTGEVELRGGDVGGVAVHVAARIEACAAPGQILVSRTVTDLVAGSDITFAPQGEHELKGVPGTWNLFAVAG
jgi:class 3 adenylate cyclase